MGPTVTVGPGIADDGPSFTQVDHTRGEPVDAPSEHGRGVVLLAIRVSGGTPFVTTGKSAALYLDSYLRTFGIDSEGEIEAPTAYHMEPPLSGEWDALILEPSGDLLFTLRFLSHREVG